MQVLKLLALVFATFLFTLLSLSVIGSFASVMLRTSGELVPPGLGASLLVAAIAAGFLARYWQLWRGHWTVAASAAAVCLLVPVLTVYGPTLVLAALAMRQGYP